MKKGWENNFTFTMEKPDKKHLSQALKVNINSGKSG